ncbi:growth arrest and DNA damage-inducible proteins-interacting protein 1 [Pangasianodon hypophthalmus]|uniref:growth arrest and DNA damage-inducible proteins-interacting protein 1 n=1 Tax=Pangasianodon hypophthalmus TaxID=310915 RepID=UPI002307D487|nr:growth arrest and DNA damage-inducible proteins-interacting protein 1 [Pangasianodon hypophthalmus]
MAASLLSRRGVALLGFSSLKSFIPVVSGNNVVQLIAGYNPRPLRLNLKEPYIPDRNSEKTPEWQKTEKYERKLFARYGFASGVDPGKLWPTAAQLEELIQEEKQWHPPLEEMLKNIAAKEKERAEKRLAREKLIAANMAKMPKMIADWRKEKQEAKRKVKEEKAKKERLLAEARERFGYALDSRSSKFQEMLAEIEKEEKKKRKLLKRRKREEEQGLTTPAPAAESS